MRNCVLVSLMLLVLQSTASSGWLVETVDNGGIINPSLALNSNGYPCIAYPVEGIGVKYAEWNGSQWLIDCAYSLVYPNLWFVSMALDTSDIPHISFGLGSLFYVTQDDMMEWQTEEVQYGGSVSHTSLALDGDGFPHIAYCHDYGASLGYASCSDSIWDIELLDTGNNTGWYVSLQMDTDGTPHMSYARKTPYLLMYSNTDTVDLWSFQVIDSLSDQCQSTSLALDGEGIPHIAYNAENELRYAYWTGTEWHLETVDACDSGSWKYGTSIALDSSDHPHIAYCSADGLYLMYTSWNGSDWHHELVDTLPGYFSGDPDLVLDDLDRPHIAFHCGYPDFALKYSWNDCTGIGEDDEQICTRLTCGLLHPNPTTGTTSMQFSLATDSHVEITMYDISGRVVERSVSGQYTAGTHTASFSVSSPGIYLVRISSENQMNTKCFIVID